MWFFFFFCLVCFVSALFSRCWRPKIGKIFTSCLYVRTLRSSSTTVRVFVPLPTVSKKNQTGSFCCIFLSFSPSIKLLWSGWHVRATQRAPSDVKPKHSHAHQYTVIVPDTRMLMFLFLSKVRHLLKDRSSVLMLEKTLCCCVFLQV